MKVNFLWIILLCCTMTLIINSCRSGNQRPGDAYDKVKEDRMLLNDTNFISEEIIQQSMRTELHLKVEKLDDWTKFENKIVMKIKRNERAIKKLKELPNSNFFFQSKLKILENNNRELRMELAEFNENMKVRFETFKTSINHDVNEIEIELNTMKALNK